MLATLVADGVGVIFGVVICIPIDFLKSSKNFWFNSTIHLGAYLRFNKIADWILSMRYDRIPIGLKYEYAYR